MVALTIYWNAPALIAFAILIAPSATVFAQYKRTDLASNQPGVAPSTDQQHLINSWGLTALPASPFWLSDNGTGFSTLYTGGGQQNPLFVTIRASASSPAGTAGTPTGIVGNISPNKTDFTVTENGKSGPLYSFLPRWTARLAPGIPVSTAYFLAQVPALP